MIVVSDTTTITNLWQIEKLHLLKDLYGRIILPQAVWEELKQMVEQQNHILQQHWIKIQTPQNTTLITELLTELDMGEAQAIALSLELEADFLIIDEKMDRNKAKVLNIKIIGLLGILLEAKRQKFIPSVRNLLDELNRKTSFFLNPKLYQEILKIAGE